MVSDQPESIKEALDVVAFGAAFKSVSALTNESECFLIMLVIHSLWSPSMMTAFAKLLINSKDISATGALKLLGCIIKADWSSMANSEIKLFCPHYWRSCPGPMHLSEVKDGLEKNWEKFEALAVSASSLPYLTCRTAFGQVTDSLKKLGAGNGQYTSAHYMRDLVIAQGSVVPGRAPLVMSKNLYEKLPEADRHVVPKEYSPCEWAYMVCMVGEKRRSIELDEALISMLASAKKAASEKRKRDDEPDGLLQGGSDQGDAAIAESHPPVKLSSGQKTRARKQTAKQTAIAHQFRKAAEQAAQEEAKRMVLEQKLREQAAELDRERELLLGSEFRFAIKEPLMEMGSEEYEFVDGLWKAQFGPDDGFAEVVGHYPKGVDEKIRVLLLLRNGEKVGARTIIEVCEGQFLVENFALIDGSQGLGYSTVFTELMIKKVRAESPGAMMLSFPVDKNIFAVERAGFTRVEGRVRGKMLKCLEDAMDDGESTIDFTSKAEPLYMAML